VSVHPIDGSETLYFGFVHPSFCFRHSGPRHSDWLAVDCSFSLIGDCSVVVQDDQVSLVQLIL